MGRKRRKAQGQAGGAAGHEAAPAHSPVAVPPGPGRPIVVSPATLSWLLAVGLALGFAWSLRELLVTFLFTGVLTFLGVPLTELLVSRRVPRSAAAGIVVSGVLLALFLLSLLVVPTLLIELAALVKKAPEALARLESFVEAQLGVHIPRSLSELTSRASADALQELQGIVQKGGAAVGKGAASVAGAVLQAAGAAGRAVFVPVLTFFLLAEWPETKAWARALSPRVAVSFADRHAEPVRLALSALVRGQLIVAGIMAGIYVVGLSISGVPLSVAIGILSGLAYVIPFASAAVCVVLSVAFSVLELAQGAGLAGVLWPILGAVVTSVVVQLIEGWVLTPRIVGEQAGLSPLAVVLAVLVFGTAFGFLGVLFALPVASAAAVIAKARVAGEGDAPLGMNLSGVGA